MLKPRPSGLTSVTLAEATSGRETATQGLQCPLMIRVPVRLEAVGPDDFVCKALDGASYSQSAAHSSGLVLVRFETDGETG